MDRRLKIIQLFAFLYLLRTAECLVLWRCNLKFNTAFRMDFEIALDKKAVLMEGPYGGKLMLYKANEN